MVAFDVRDVEYPEYSNRQLAAIPLAVLALALLVLVGWYAMTGAPVTPGIAFTGGTEIQVSTVGSDVAIDDAFALEPESTRQVRGEASYVVTFQSTDTDAIRESAEQAGYTVESVQGTSASFSAETQQLGLLGLGAAFVGMALLVFGMFRTFVPSVAVVLSAFSDIAIPLALMNLTGIKLSLGTVAALLMLIGYSVDSDILLNNHILRRSGEFYESTHRAMRTGVTMTLTSMSP